MIDARSLDKIFKVCKSHSVSHLKMPELEVSFVCHPVTRDEASTPVPASDSTDKIAEVLKKQEESLPPDLRADDLMSQDKALFWSSPGGEQMPLAGEQEL